jgi:hypothetical protein
MGLMEREGRVESAELTVGIHEGNDVEVVAVEVEGGVVVCSVGGGQLIG